MAKGLPWAFCRKNSSAALPSKSGFLDKPVHISYNRSIDKEWRKGVASVKLWTRKTLWVVLNPLLLAAGIVGIVPRSIFPAHSFLWPPLLIGCGWLTLRFTQLENQQKSAYWLGFAFSFFFALGYLMRFQNGIGGLAGWWLLLAAAAGAAPAVAFGIACLYKCCMQLKKRPALADGSPKRAFGLYFSVLLCCWLPVFLAYYPGLFAYDVAYQIPQVVEGVYRAHHPLIHTLFLGAFYRLGGVLGSYTTGMALYTLCQMVLLALALAYTLAYLYRQQVPRALRIACLLFFALCPIHSLMAISITKDVLYSAAVLLTLLFVHEAWICPKVLEKRGYCLRLTLVTALACLLRTNGAVIFLLLCALLFWHRAKNHGLARRLILLLLSGMLLFGTSAAGLSKLLTAQPAPLKEAISVPLQQVSRVYSLHKETLDCTEEIEAMIPGVYAYGATFADHVKAYANVGTGNIRAFIELWIRLGLRYPAEYVDAFWLNCQGFWFMDDTSQASHYGVGLEGRQGYLLTDTKEDLGVEHISYFPGLESLYENLFSANHYQQIPVISVLFSLALYTWMTGFLLFAATREKRTDLVLFAGTLLGSVLLLCALSPCAIVRYQYPLMLGVPILLGLLCSPAPREPSKIKTTA